MSNPKSGHTMGRSGRSARRSGRAGSGKIGCQQNYSPRKQKSTVHSKAPKTYRLNISSEARTVVCRGVSVRAHFVSVEEQTAHPLWVTKPPVDWFGEYESIPGSGLVRDFFRSLFQPSVRPRTASDFWSSNGGNSRPFPRWLFSEWRADFESPLGVPSRSVCGEL